MQPMGTKEVEYFIAFDNEKQKLEFVDYFAHLALNNSRLPFRSQYIDNEVLILINDACVKIFNNKFPNLKFMEANKNDFKYLTFRNFGKDIEPSWWDAP